MASNVYMVIVDQNNAVVAGESVTAVYDPYLKRAVAKPVELFTFDSETTNTSTISSTGGGAGKVSFEPLSVVRRVDVVSQTLFLAAAMGTPLKYVDLMVVRSTGEDPGSTGLKPYLSLRLGTVLINDIVQTNDDESVTETVRFEYGQYQIGYQSQKPDGTYNPFAPVGWDRVRNVRI